MNLNLSYSNHNSYNQEKINTILSGLSKKLKEHYNKCYKDLIQKCISSDSLDNDCIYYEQDKIFEIEKIIIKQLVHYKNDLKLFIQGKINLSKEDIIFKINFIERYINRTSTFTKKNYYEIKKEVERLL